MSKCKATKKNGQPCGQTQELSVDGYCKYHNIPKYKNVSKKPKLVEALDYLLNEYPTWCREKELDLPDELEALTALKNYLDGGVSPPRGVSPPHDDD